MTPVERLQAAIDKLERLRASSQNWRVSTETLAWTASEGSAENIAMLYETVVPQLGILRHAAARIQSKTKTGGGEAAVWSTDRDAIALADAILGGAA